MSNTTLVLSMLFFAFVMPLAAGEEARQKTFRFEGSETVSLLLDLGETVQSYQQLVTTDGFISGPSFGTANVLGKTILESTEVVREAITKKSGRLNPRVSILLLQVPMEREKRKVYVLGEVKTPKAVEFPRGQNYRLAACLAEAGGPTLEADLARVKLLREGPNGIQAQEVDCTQFARAGQENLGPLVETGDVVIVNKAETVTVAGEVLKPGVVTRQAANLAPRAPFHLSRALLAAGGLKPSGDKSDIRLLRMQPDGTVAVTTHKMVDGRIANDPVLETGDVVEVTIGLGITILGGVGSPGIYYELGGHPMTLSRLMALAGGATSKAKVSNVFVVRKSNPGVPANINLRGIIEEGKLTEDIKLEPGDMVFVPVSTF